MRTTLLALLLILVGFAFAIARLADSTATEWVWVDPNYCTDHGEGLLCHIDPLAGP